MRCAALPHSRSHKVACPIITRYNAVVPGWVDTPTKCVPKVRPSLLATPSLQERTFGTHPGGEVPFPAQLPLYRVMISCTHFGVLPTLLRSATTMLHALLTQRNLLAPLALSPPSRRPSRHPSAAAAAQNSTALLKSIPRP